MSITGFTLDEVRRGLMHSTDLPLVEVAPNYFIRSWGDIQSGRISGAVKKFFTITLTSGDYYHVPEADIEATLEA